MSLHPSFQYWHPRMKAAYISKSLVRVGQNAALRGRRVLMHDDNKLINFEYKSTIRAHPDKQRDLDHGHCSSSYTHQPRLTTVLRKMCMTVPKHTDLQAIGQSLSKMRTP